MTGWSLSDYLLAFTLACLMLLPILWSIYLLAERRGRRAPTHTPPQAPDWSSIADYLDLTSVAADAHFLGPEEYLAGPFHRFLELGSAPEVHPRGRARAMEFAREGLRRYCEALHARGEDGGATQARARAVAAEWFARREVPNGDYMLEVLDGVSSHNFRGTRDG